MFILFSLISIKQRTYQIAATVVIALIDGFFSGLQGISRDDLLIAALIGANVVADQATAAGTTLFSIVFPISIAASLGISQER